MTLIDDTIVDPFSVTFASGMLVNLLKTVFS